MAIALVQKAGFVNNTTITVSQAFSSNNTAGNLLVAMIGTYSGNDITSITDTQGNTWVKVPTLATASFNNVAIYYAANCKAGANTVTVNKSGTTVRVYLAIAEYSGVATSGVILDQTTYPISATSASPATNIKVANQGELLILMHRNGSSARNFTSPSGFTIQAGASNSFVMWGDNQNSSQYLNNFSCTMSGSDGWQENVAAFLPATPAVAPTLGINYVRSTESCQKNTSPSPGSPTQAIFSGGNAAGNLILAVTNEFFPSTDQVTGITDTAGNTYTKLLGNFSSNFTMVQSIWYAIANGSTSGNTLSAAFTNAGINDSVDLVAFEFSGQAASNILDAAATATAFANATSLSYTATPSAKNEMLFTINFRNSGPNTWSAFGAGNPVNIQPSKGTSNSETQVSFLLNAPLSANTIAVTDSAVQIGGLTFAIKSATYSVSGNCGSAGATISFSGDASGTTTADGSGNYTVTGVPVNGTITITPTKTNITFTPTSQQVTVTGNLTGVNFSATSGVYSVPDCRNFGVFPNNSVNVNGTLQYTVPAHPSTTPPVDSRAAGAPQDCRLPGNIPVNCRIG